ncbi:MAG TPA: AAA family ATPase [Kofleriaceae bacterium]|nr:AAA family ATPase [Kofleriaceae bacterium]
MRRRVPRAPLSPHGTTRLRFAELAGGGAPVDELGSFFRGLARGAGAHELADDSLYLAEELVRLSSFGGERDRRALAVALVALLSALRQGSTRLPLGGGASGPLGRHIKALAREGELELDVRTLVADIGRLAAELTFDRLIGRGDEHRPMVVDDGHLYLHRMWFIERALVTRVRARVEAPADLPQSIDDPQLSDQQRTAITAALSQPLALITGGPGTGKTAIVRALVRAAIAAGIPADQIAIAAPTGKAVNRLATALAAESGPPPVPPVTLHRLLGWQPAASRFRHHDNDPLPAALVIVDEASMIDMILMERLLRAVRTDARLALIGDADQLPSVDAGAVFRDLCAALPDRTHRLTRSYRMDPADPAGRAVLGLARRINAGEPPLPLPADAAPHVIHVDAGTPAAVARFVARWYDDHWRAGGEVDDLARRCYRFRAGQLDADDDAALRRLFALAERGRLLTATRRLAGGSEAINRQLHDRVLAGSSLDGRVDLYPGEPVLVAVNDYPRGLYNGDQGMIARVSEDGGAQHFRAVFPRAGGWAVFSIDALRAHLELAFAMTVHKAQGSEFDHVALLLPPRDLPLLGRELLYTAITRARRSVTLVGSTRLIELAAARPADRTSGLAAALTR